MRAASWLLNRSGVDQALMGDLNEEHRRGRTASWLSQQTLVAVAKAVTISARQHINSLFRFLIVPIVVFCGACLADRDRSHAVEMP